MCVSLKKRKGNKKKSFNIFLLAFLPKKIIFDSMGNIKGLSGIFWFFTIILIPIKMKKWDIGDSTFSLTMPVKLP